MVIAYVPPRRFWSLNPKLALRESSHLTLHNPQTSLKISLTEEASKDLVSVAWSSGKIFDNALHLREKRTVELQLVFFPVRQLPVESSANGLPISSISVIDNRLRFNGEVSILLSKTEIEREGDV